MSPSEILAAKIVESGTGEKIIVESPVGSGKYEFVKDIPVGLDPGTLSQILDVILGFIVGLIDKLREGNLCVKTDAITMSVDEKVNAVVKTAKNPSRLQRARIQVNLKNDLVGLPVDSWKMTYSTLDTVADSNNKELVKASISEGNNPDFGWI